MAVGEHFKEAQTRMGFSSRTKDTFSLHDGRRAALGVCGNQSTVPDVVCICTAGPADSAATSDAIKD